MDGLIVTHPNRIGYPANERSDRPRTMKGDEIVRLIELSLHIPNLAVRPE
jgi:hypothetical protein